MRRSSFTVRLALLLTVLVATSSMRAAAQAVPAASPVPSIVDAPHLSALGGTTPPLAQASGLRAQPIP
jgi:hypothetical protein